MTSEAEPSASEQSHITFNIKSSNDQKHVVTVPESMTVLELKQKLSTSEYADVAPERQRLIYSGRVLKDPDTLASYKIKDGNTVHMVKSAASNQQRNPANQSSTSSSTNPASAAVPQNIAAGTGNDPLAGLTGARYAGFAQLPGANTFGADGGLGANPNDPEEMLRMLENPMFVQQMNEAMNNPMAIQMMQQHPMIRNNPAMREMLNSPEFRRMMLDPEMIRMSMRMAGNRGVFGEGAQNSMPAPGVTDTTPGQDRSEPSSGDAQTDSGTTGQTNNAPGGNTGTNQPPADPLSMFGQLGGGNRQDNPWASLFGAAPPNFPNTQNPSQTRDNTSSGAQTNDQQTETGQQQQQFGANPFAQLFGAAGNSSQGQDGQQQSPFAAMTQQLMQNPQLMNSIMQGMGGGAQGGDGQAGGFNPLSMFGAPNSPPAPPDNRPPEEMYAEQLRQLNDMGFHDFDRNVQALRRAGGSVQGAIENLLGGS